MGAKAFIVPSKPSVSSGKINLVLDCTQFEVFTKSEKANLSVPADFLGAFLLFC